MDDKIFGYDEKEFDEIIGAYCEKPHSHIENTKLSDAHFWESVKKGTEELSKKKHIIDLI